MTRRDSPVRSIAWALILGAGACAPATTERPDNPGGYRDLEVPSRWGDYPLAGALARLGDGSGIDWVDHLTNCGLTDAWIEDMRAAWWSEREYSVSAILEAELSIPFATLARLEHRAETIRIRYGKIGGETTAENGLRREIAAIRDRILELCPILEDPDLFWIEEAIYADEVTITLETATGDTIRADALTGMLGVPMRWTVSDAGVMRSEDRVYVAFRNASPAGRLISEDADAAFQGTGDLAFIPHGLFRRPAPVRER